MIENTSESMKKKERVRAFLGQSMVEGSPTGAIEDQEAQGQRDVCGQASQLPIKCSEQDEAALAKAGVVFGEHCEGDDQFRHATLPEGWMILPTDHSMWSRLVDATQATRGKIFYKAAFYDRRAMLHASCRYTRECRFSDDGKTVKIRAVDGAASEVLTETESHDRDDYEAYDADLKEVALWLEENFPNYEDPSAYWPEPASQG